MTRVEKPAAIGARRASVFVNWQVGEAEDSPSQIPRLVPSPPRCPDRATAAAVAVIQITSTAPRQQRQQQVEQCLRNEFEDERRQAAADRELSERLRLAKPEPDGLSSPDSACGKPQRICLELLHEHEQQREDGSPTNSRFLGAIIRFPLRNSFVIWLLREANAWRVVAGDHGWMFRSRREAISEAHRLARIFNDPVCKVAP